MQNKLKKNKKNKKKITLMELFCLVIILGTFLAMGIISLSDFVSKTRDDLEYQEENLAIIAAKKYLKKHNDLQPSVLGETRNLKVKDLYNSNYLKDKYNNACLDNSYVRIYKYSDSEYTYTPYIYCDGEEKSHYEIIPMPIVEIRFLKANDKEIKNTKVTLKDKFELLISGGINSDGQYLDIDSYSYEVSSRLENEQFIVNYNSSEINVNYDDEVEVTKSIYDYVTDIRVKEVKIDVSVKNVAGGKKDYTILFKIV